MEREHFDDSRILIWQMKRELAQARAAIGVDPAAFARHTARWMELTSEWERVWKARSAVGIGSPGDRGERDIIVIETKSAAEAMPAIA